MFCFVSFRLLVSTITLVVTERQLKSLLLLVTQKSANLASSNFPSQVLLADEPIANIYLSLFKYFTVGSYMYIEILKMYTYP